MKASFPAAAVAAIMHAYSGQSIPQLKASTPGRNVVAATTGVTYDDQLLVFRPFEQFEVRAHGVGVVNPAAWKVIVSIELPEVGVNGRPTGKWRRHNVWIVGTDYGLYKNEDSPGLSARTELQYIAEFLANPPRGFAALWPRERINPLRRAYLALLDCYDNPDREGLIRQLFQGSRKAAAA